MSELVPIAPPVFAVLFVAVLVGALIQGTIGFGLNVVAAPVAAIVEPEALPAAMIILSLPMTAGSALRERGHIDRRGVAYSTLGRLPGIGLGTLVVVHLEPSELAIWIGAMIVVASLMSIARTKTTITSRSAAFAGAVAGLMGTTSSMGGPPLALLYQHEPGPILRSTLGATLLIGSTLSLAALALAGHVAPWHWLLGLSLMPAVALGLVASRTFLARIDAGWLRPAVVGLAGLAGLAVALRGLA